MKINRIPLVFIIFLILLALSAVLSLSIGSVPLSFGKVCSILAGKGGSTQEVNIIMQIRLPRLIMAFLLGGALSLSGFLLQTYFQNPIAGPFVLGISSGAKMTVALALIFLLKRGFASSSLWSGNSTFKVKIEHDKGCQVCPVCCFSRTIIICFCDFARWV